MAYAFSQIDKLVNDDENKQDIFGGGSQTLDGGGGGDLALLQQPGSDVKASTEGDLGGAAPSGGGSETSNASAPTPADQSRVFSANQGKTAIPQGVYGIQNQIAANEKALQDNANQYTTDYKAQYDAYGVDNATMDSAIGDNNSDAYKKTSEFLNKGTADPVAKGMEGIDDLYVNDMNLLSNSAGQQQLASRGQGSRYSQGMSAFDTMLMQRDPNFTGLINDIQGQNRGLESQLEARPDELAAEAATYGGTALTGSQDKAKTYLTGKNSSLEAINQAEADAYNEELKNLDQGSIAAAAGQSAYDQVEKDFGQEYGARGDRFIKGEAYDPSQFATFDEADYGLRDFVDKDEASQFNNINGLLGLGGQSYSAATGPGAQYSFDTTGLQNQLYTGAADRRAEEDRILSEEYQKIMNDAKLRADADDERRSGLRNTFNADRDAVTQSIIDSQGTDAQQWYNDSMQNSYQGNLGNPALDLQGSDVYTPEEVARMNSITNDLTNVVGTVQEGQHQNTGNFFNQDDYTKYLTEQMNAARDRYSPTVPEGATVPQAKAILDNQIVINNETGAPIRRGDVPPPPMPSVGQLQIGQDTYSPMEPTNRIPVRERDDYVGDYEVSPNEAYDMGNLGQLPSFVADMGSAPAPARAPVSEPREDYAFEWGNAPWYKDPRNFR